MNEFEWLQQTRALARPEPPRQDLWAGIATRINASTGASTQRPSRLLPWAMAASLAAFSVLAGFIAWQQQTAPTPRLPMHLASTATTPWKPRDPHLVGAAIELNIARRQLARAIQRAPDEIFLQRMLAHTNQQIERLQHLPHRAG